MFKVTSWLEKLHPIVLHACKKPSDIIACYDSTIPFTQLHAKANKLIPSWNNNDFFTSNPNILIPETSKNFWDFVENGESSSFSFLAANNIKVGPINIMRTAFPNQNFVANQQNPDVAQNFSKSNYEFKGSVGLDFKNATGKTQMDGRNQVIIGNFDHYMRCVNTYKNLITDFSNYKELIIVVKQIQDVAKRHDWEGQLQLFANNIHKFPPKYLPPLFAEHKFPKQALKHHVAIEVQQSLKKMRELSRKAYENNIPEDTFNESHIQWLLSQLEE